jgi:hypothetical protein
MGFAMAVMNDDDQVPRKPCCLSRGCTLIIRRPTPFAPLWRHPLFLLFGISWCLNDIDHQPQHYFSAEE